LQNILVIFEATNESTEGLALALGLGAVQAGANIRLRHLNPSPAAKLAHQSYGRLKADDLRWAEGIAIVLETGEPAALDEIVQSLDQFSEDGDPVSRVVYVTGGNADEKSVRDLNEKLQRAGLLPLREEVTHSTANLAFMTQIGQRLAEEQL
jgi:hypothetical protein